MESLLALPTDRVLKLSCGTDGFGAAMSSCELEEIGVEVPRCEVVVMMLEEELEEEKDAELGEVPNAPPERVDQPSLKRDSKVM